MTQPEFLAWKEFFRLYPFDDLHRYHRPAALIASSMSSDFNAKLEFLFPEPPPPGYSEADMNIFRAFGVRPPPRKK